MVDASVVVFWLNIHAKSPTWWSPSSFNRLHACAYRFALSSDSEIYNKFAKPNTFAALGTAAHRLTERAWLNEFATTEDKDLASTLLVAWNEEVEIQFRKMQVAWAPALVPTPSDWPYFSINKNRSIRRITDEIVEFRNRGDHLKNFDRPWVEHEIFDEESHLKGTPDRVILFDDGFVIQDLKTGFKVNEMTESHRRQLLLYAHLVRSDTQKSPERIEVIKSDGQILEEHISDMDVDECLQDFKNITKKYSGVVERGSINSSMATPSPDLCGHCHYRSVCEPFWTDNESDWGTTRGVVGRVARVGNSTTLTIEQKYPIDGAGAMIGVSNVHHLASVGDMISIVNAYQRGPSLRGRWNTVSTILEKPE